jgi:hypothetical protein
LPDFLASRLPGLLTSIEAAAVEAKLAASMEAAADTLRGFEVTLPSALRWLRRRVRAVQAALEAVSRLVPQRFGRALASDPTLWIELGQGCALLDLRRSLAPHLLHRLPAPLGFLPSRGAARSRDGNQHDMGPDAERDIRYGVTADVRRPPCNVIPPILCHQLPFRRPQTCCAFGVPTAACTAAAPACTCSGSRGTEPTAPSAGLTSGPS